MATKPTTVPTTSGTSSQVTPFSQSPAPPNTGITSGLLTAIQDKAGSQPATKAPVQAQVPPGPQVAQNVNSPPLSGGQPVQPGPAQAPPGAPPAQAAQPTQPAQNPDFILDLGPNTDPTGKTYKPNPVQPYSWTIRSWDAAQAEITASGGFGIISYAWGKWHDKAQQVLGGTKDPRPGGVDHKINPNGYPSFDLGVSTTESKNGPDLYNPPVGGKDVPVTSFGVGDARIVPVGTRLSWMFPKVCPMDFTKIPPTVANPNAEVFTIHEIYNAISKLGRRFIWWDWACIPQGWDSDFRTKEKKGPEFQTHGDLLKKAESSMNKMRLFYPASKSGLVWWHETNFKTGALQPVIPMVKLVKSMMELTGTKDITDTWAFDFAENVSCIAKSESSLQSLWSFQEAVLFSSEARPQQAPRIRADEPLRTPSVVLDKTGTGYPAPNGEATVFCKEGHLNFEDLVDLAAEVAHVIGMALMGYPGRDEPNSAPPVAANTPVKTWLSVWARLSANQAAARGLLSKLISTGFVGLQWNRPLSLLEARFAREVRADSRVMDVSVNTLMGALCVDMTQAQANADASIARIYGKKPDWALADAKRLHLLRGAFISGLFDLYQWRLLLFARQWTITQASPAGNAVSIWESLVGTTRPKVATLYGYMDPDTALSNLYGPGPRGPADDIVKGLPKLSFDISEHNLLKFTTDGVYGFYDYPTPVGAQVSTLKGWQAGAFYQFVDTDSTWLPPTTISWTEPAPIPANPPPALLAGTVRAVNAVYPPAEEVLGKNVMLFPFQIKVEQPPLFTGIAATKASTWVRCFVMTRDSATSSSLMYKGVGDFFGIGDPAKSEKDVVFTIM